MRKTRPGGRTARTRALVFAAVEALLEEKDPGAISMVEIAGKAGVAATSLYRRWGDARSLLTEVAVGALTREAPLPDTGSLREDLRAWARTIAATLSDPQKSIFFRVYVGAVPRSDKEAVGRARALRTRLQQIDAMLERARMRGEVNLNPLEVTDHLLAPLYMRALFGAPADADFAEGLVDYLLQGDHGAYVNVADVS
ncbi:TetR/AcrR family transcriptional regulator C-terminal ligand-binding domain-containing protein [Beijerinckia sp. L45]|uniref:TetR/AcrR family transcriptional regulator C-terminal ligand-binding domain-containing protein n=1 Tax=Beijerinckia sp. L45 TaxID=1641855 RepID=UPI00131E28D9|nr:TetR/AcrR family transcriptional regulator C-terminal ligand-binding domain-containing protein [Beijerinckia sp. L45]